MFSAQFSLPLPLLTRQSDDNRNNNKRDRHYCAIALWDEGVAMKGCASAARMVHELLSVQDPISSLLDKIGRSPPVLGDIPLLANFNLQTFCQPGWYFNLVTFISSFKLHVSSRYLYIVLSY